eukprot:Opistho-2@79691
MRTSTILATAAVIAAVCAVASSAPVSSLKWIPDENTRGMWVWDQRNLPSDTAGMDAFFTFLKAPNGRTDLRINRLYFYAGLSNVNTGNTALRNFLKRAHAQNVAVELLEGDPQWVTTASGVQTAIGVCNTVAAFNAATAGSDDDFDGVHMDIEPHVLAGWKTNAGSDGYNIDYENNFVNVYVQCKAVMASKSPATTVAADIGWWYTQTNIFGMLQSKQAVDFFNIMAYYDTYTPFASAITANLASSTIPVNVGIETIDPNSAPDAQSFYQEGWVAMELQLRKAYDAFGTKPYFAGFSIHHYGSYHTLQSGAAASTLPVRILPDSVRPGAAGSAVVRPVPTTSTVPKPVVKSSTVVAAKTTSAPKATSTPVKATSTPAAPKQSSSAVVAKTTSTPVKATSTPTSPKQSSSAVAVPMATSSAAAILSPAASSAAPGACSCRSITVDPFSSVSSTNSFGLPTGDDNTMKSMTMSSGIMQLTAQSANDYWYSTISKGCYSLAPYEWMTFTFAGPAAGAASIALQTAAAGCADAVGTDYTASLAKYSTFDGVQHSVMIPLSDFAAQGASISQIRAIVIKGLGLSGTYSFGLIRFVGCDA